MKKSLFTVLIVVAAMFVAQTSFCSPFNPPPTIPDASSSALLLTIAAGGLAWGRKFFRR